MVIAPYRNVLPAHRHVAAQTEPAETLGGPSDQAPDRVETARSARGSGCEASPDRRAGPGAFGRSLRLAKPGPVIARRLLAMPALLALIAGQAAAAQSITLVERETRLRGTFAVGAGTNSDNGNYALDLLTPDLSFATVANDNGAAAAGSASFSMAQSYAVFERKVNFSASALTSVQAPPDVLAFSDALSQLSLVLVLASDTPFELQVNAFETLGATVNNLAPRANAQFRLSGPGESWLYNTPGSFLQAGVLTAGTWRVDTFADARGTGHAGVIGTLLLAPVPEPATWLLMAGGIAALLSRRLPFAGHLP